VNGSNLAPTVNITSPINNSTLNEGTVLSITANAQDSDGTISKVEFFVDGKSIGSTTASPYSVNYTSPAGSHTINAIATDDKGASTTSSSIIINVNGINKTPTISITSPINNTSVNEGAIISITANAQDSDGSISKVEFFVDGKSIGSTTAIPYSVNYTAVAGTHTLTAVATDNKLATTTSPAISLTVNTNNNTCSGIAQYTENGGYVAGSKVQNQGNQYQCKPWPYSGWCNGAAWAYGPGTGAYWSDAWILIGSCNAKMGLQTNSSLENSIEVVPNPVEYSATIRMNFSILDHARVVITNTLGMEVYKGEIDSSAEPNLNLSKLESGVYVIRIISNDTTYEHKFVKQ
jgi:chitinase